MAHSESHLSFLIHVMLAGDGDVGVTQGVAGGVDAVLSADLAAIFLP